MSSLLTCRIYSAPIGSFLVLIAGFSYKTMFNKELCTSSVPLYSMKPNLRNLFMKKLTRDRVVPIISASISWLYFPTIRSGLPSLPKFARRRRRRAFSECRRSRFMSTHPSGNGWTLPPTEDHINITSFVLCAQQLALRRLWMVSRLGRPLVRNPQVNRRSPGLRVEETAVCRKRWRRLPAEACVGR